MAYIQNPKSPVAKALKGNQHKLPQHLQDAIKAAPESSAKQTASSKEITKGSFGKASKNAKDNSGDPRISGQNEKLKSGIVEKDYRPAVVEDRSIASFNGKKYYTVTGEAKRPNTSSRQDNTSPAQKYKK